MALHSTHKIWWPDLSVVMSNGSDKSVMATGVFEVYLDCLRHSVFNLSVQLGCTLLAFKFGLLLVSSQVMRLRHSQESHGNLLRVNETRGAVCGRMSRFNEYIFGSLFAL